MRRSKISLKAEVSSRGGVSDLLKEPGDAVLIQRGVPRWLMLKCPCGCGEEIPVNLDARAGKAWRLYRSKTGLTLFPSVWRDTGCEAHFIIWRDQIVTFGGGQASNNSPALTLDVSDLARRTLAAWPGGDFISYVDVADQLGEIPWDVQEACYRLVEKGLMVAGKGSNRGSFRKV
ncbi:hypothetical protein ASC95_08405 [Pelomonas sp. Root1217]|uniref:DUF6527 family protein n=1 Tax=Pelomonas sp. Root1217 TaxID=1736430 RepID=UPI0007153BED|nr:DUF6527 family protein [Pelomonas sp. Root1217]KQV52816.1 hypothetical protein ASC95_08405 [Pelomonas sp. Root1217]